MAKLVVIAGPTASGKTALSLKLAKKFELEIINADSRQLYKYMDIGTAKPTQYEQEEVRHHLIDILSPDEQFSSALFAENAKKIFSQSVKTAFLITGGAGFYIKSLLFGLFEHFEDNEIIRQNLQKFFGKLNLQEFPHLWLKRLDPEAAGRIHRNDLVRTIRALEVYFSTGKTISSLQKVHGFQKAVYPYIKIGLMLEKSVLHDRIARRVSTMLSNGLVDETKRLLDLGFSEELPVMKTIGYKQAVQYLKGNLKKEELQEAICLHTRKYAKSQLTWFRGEKDINWFDPEKEEEKIFAAVEKFLKI